MKKAILLLFILFAAAGPLFSIESRRDYFLKPQIGLWFGPVTPIGSTGKALDANLGGGIFFRYNLPWRYFKVGFDAGYEFFKQNDGVNKMHFMPFYGNVLFLLPIPIPLKFQLKAGAGAGWLHIQPDKKNRWDPIFVFGGEVSFPAGRFVNIGLRTDYIFIYEQYLKGAVYNGHVLNIGIAVYFNLNL